MDHHSQAGRLARAGQLLHEIHNVAMATVNADGSPHLSPVFMAFDEQLNGYWSSHPDSQHSQNIVRTGQAFLTVFDSREGHGGLYIEAMAHLLEDRQAKAQALAVLQKLKAALGRRMGPLSHYTGSGPQRLYQAAPVRLSMSHAHRDHHGVITRDARTEVTLADLCSAWLE